jgi:hypothetical protein
MALVTISMVGTHILDPLPQATAMNKRRLRPMEDLLLMLLSSSLLTNWLRRATDPSGGGWYYAPTSSQCFSAGSVENADQCAWYFPNSTWSSYHYYNLVIGTARYNVQSNWNLSKEACLVAKGNLARFFVAFILFYIPLYCDCNQNLINHWPSLSFSDYAKFKFYNMILANGFKSWLLNLANRMKSCPTLFSLNKICCICLCLIKQLLGVTRLSFLSSCCFSYNLLVWQTLYTYDLTILK